MGIFYGNIKVFLIARIWPCRKVLPLHASIHLFSSRLRQRDEIRRPLLIHSYCLRTEDVWGKVRVRCPSMFMFYGKSGNHSNFMALQSDVLSQQCIFLRQKVRENHRHFIPLSMRRNIRCLVFTHFLHQKSTLTEYTSQYCWRQAIDPTKTFVLQNVRNLRLLPVQIPVLYPIEDLPAFFAKIPRVFGESFNPSRAGACVAADKEQTA